VFLFIVPWATQGAPFYSTVKIEVSVHPVRALEVGASVLKKVLLSPVPTVELTFHEISSDVSSIPGGRLVGCLVADVDLFEVDPTANFRAVAGPLESLLSGRKHEFAKSKDRRTWFTFDGLSIRRHGFYRLKVTLSEKNPDGTYRGMGTPLAECWTKPFEVSEQKI